MNKLIADGRPVSDDEGAKLRKSYHRINDEDELNSACVTWAHFPCVVHIGNDLRFVEHGTGLPQRVTGNHLYFLVPVTNPALSDSIETAYDQAEIVMNQFISYMRQDYEDHAGCGNLFLFDMNRMKAQMIGPINIKLFGWYLIFEDENIAKDLLYVAGNWFIDMP